MFVGEYDSDFEREGSEFALSRGEVEVGAKSDQSFPLQRQDSKLARRRMHPKLSLQYKSGHFHLHLRISPCSHLGSFHILSPSRNHAYIYPNHICRTVPGNFHMDCS